MPEQPDDSDTDPPPDATSGRSRPSMTRGERVRAAARTLRTPRTASWVADETAVSVKTAQKYLDQLVEDQLLQTIERGDQTLYCIDQLMATYREIATLQRDHDRDALSDTLTSMRDRIADWKETYDVESPGELRASIAEVEDSQETERRREIASEWEHLKTRLPLVQSALREYDWVNDHAAVPA